MTTLSQLHNKARQTKLKKLRAPHFDGAPMRKGMVYKVTYMAPRKPNSAKRTYCKVKVLINGKRLFAKVPGIGEHFLQTHSMVLIKGGGAKDCPSVRYSLVRGVYDFNKPELFGRFKRRSKFGVKKPEI